MRGRRRWVRGRASSALLLTALVVLFTLIGSGVALAAPPWSDAPNSWWQSSYGITDTQAGTVADGYADGTFRPGLDVTRGQFAKMAVNGLGVPTANPATPTFKDVAKGSTFYIYIEGAYVYGLVGGYVRPDGLYYYPGTTISRQQANSILGRYLSEKEKDLKGYIEGATGTYSSLDAWYAAEGVAILAGFTDGASVAPVHAPATAYLVYHDVVKGSSGGGTGYLNPTANLVRSQAVALVLRVAAVSFTVQPPTVTMLNPAAGPSAGGNSVTIVGTNFSAVSAVKFGTNDAMSYVVNSTTQITAVAPPGTSGTTVDVTVTNSAGTSSLSAGSKYHYGIPVITSLEPNGGPAEGGNQVVITGYGFVGLSAESDVKFGTNNAITYTVDSSTQIRATAPPGVSGTTVDVVVTSVMGSSVASEATKYTYGVPTVTGVNPAAGPAAGGNTVVITGTGFADISGADAVKFGDVNATSYTVDSSTQITAVAPPGTAGTTVDVTVSNSVGPSGASDASKYSYGPPTVTMLNPAGGPAAGGNDVLIIGTGFTGVTAVKFGAIDAPLYTVRSTTLISAVAPPGTAGTTVDVTVTNPAGTSSIAGTGNDYSYGMPTVTGVNPAAGPAAGGNTVVITGTNFFNVNNVRFGFMYATSYTVDSPTQITVTAPSGTAGTTVDVTVDTDAGTSVTSPASKYSYGIPTVTGLNPTAGPAGGGTSVIITGTGFTGVSGPAAVKFGGINAITYTVYSSTQIVAVAPPGALGSTVDVTVTNPVGTSAISSKSKYSYITLPTVTDVEPDGGPAAGGNTVTITGTYLVGVTQVLFGTKVATGIQEVAGSGGTLLTVVAPSGKSGTTVDVRVTNTVGTSAVSEDTKYSYGIPTITSLNPAAGPPGGGNTVIINGTVFIDPVTAVTFYDPVTDTSKAAAFTRNSNEQITAVAPNFPDGTTVEVTVEVAGKGTSEVTLASMYSYGAPTVTDLTPNGGPTAGGNQVIITGTGFTGVSGGVAVKFGTANVPAEDYTVDSPTQITVWQAPAKATGDPSTVDVTVANAYDVSDTAGTGNNYHYGIPTITNLNPAAGPPGGTNSVVITGTNFTGVTGPTGVKFGTTNAASYVVDSATQITAVAPSGADGTTVDVKVKNAAGTSVPDAISKYSYGLPQVLDLNPTGGPAGGGNTVVITGKCFTGVTGVMFGTAVVPALDYTVDSPTQITVLQAPAKATGDPTTVDVTVTTHVGTSSTAGSDNDYIYGLPTVTDLNPAAGPPEGGNQIVITGTNFLGTTLIEFNGSTVVPGDFTVNPDGTTITIPDVPPHAAGTVHVKVTNASGTSVESAASKYTYGPPTVTNLNPNGGPPSGGNTVVITGTGFTGVTGNAGVKFGSKNVGAANYTVDSDTQITAVAPSGTAGTTVDVTVTNPAGTSSTTGTDDNYSYGIPTVTGLDPAAGAQSDLVVIHGTNFTSVTAVAFGNAVVNPANYVVNSTTEITVVVPAKDVGDPDTVDVTVTNPAGTSATSYHSKFTYGKPKVTGLDPNGGKASGGNWVTITGKGFTGVTAVEFDDGTNPPVPAISYIVDDEEQIRAKAPAGVNGTKVDVRVTNTVGISSKAGTGNDYYYGLPTVTSLTHASGSNSGGETVIIRGANFENVTAVEFDDGTNPPIPATSYTVVSDRRIDAVVPNGPDNTTVDVTVTNLAGTSATTLASKYTFGPPDITLLNPTNGPWEGGNTVVITGMGFTGVTDVLFGSEPAVFEVNSPTQITAVAPMGPVTGGTVRVKVTTWGGNSPNEADDDYTYNP